MNWILENMATKWQRWILGTRTDHTRANYVWNMIGSGLYAAATIVLVRLTMTAAGTGAGADFNIAFKTGQILLTVGYFEIRPFQVTDARGEYSWHDYFSFRLITCAAMGVCGLGYPLITKETGQRLLLFVLLCLYKLMDGLADVFEGEFQKSGRMDVAGKSVAFRTLLSVGIYAVMLQATGNVVLSVCAMVLAAGAGVLIFDVSLISAFVRPEVRPRPEPYSQPQTEPDRLPQPEMNVQPKSDLDMKPQPEPYSQPQTDLDRMPQPEMNVQLKSDLNINEQSENVRKASAGARYALRPSFDRRRMGSLFRSTVLLFAGSILCLYIFNASNYAVDAFYQGEDALSQDLRYIYACVFMPTSVINLASGFLFKPMLTTMADHYAQGRMRQFGLLIIRLLGWVLLLTVVCLAGGALLGIPVLSVIYGYDLTGYETELEILILGGGFNASGILLYYAMTTMRRQADILISYGIVTAATLAVSTAAVQRYGLLGAAVSYCAVMFLETVVFAVAVVTSYHREKSQRI